jgi:hypothetical protein
MLIMTQADNGKFGLLATYGKTLLATEYDDRGSYLATYKNMPTFAYYGYIQKSRCSRVYYTVRNGRRLQEIPLRNEMGEEL